MNLPFKIGCEFSGSIRACEHVAESESKSNILFPCVWGEDGKTPAKWSSSTIMSSGIKRSIRVEYYLLQELTGRSTTMTSASGG
jgi:hypothetical protein